MSEETHTDTKPAPYVSKKGNDRVMARRIKKSAKTTPGSMAGVAFNTRVGAAGSGVIQSVAQNFFSLTLSTDFLELPQNDLERYEWYRYFADNDPFVGQSLEILTTIPLSKIRLSKPKCSSNEKADKIMAYFEKMADDINLTERLYEITNLYWLDGNVFIFAEDDIETGEKYRGWRKLNVLEARQIKIQCYGFSNEADIEFIPTEEDRRAIQDASTDPVAAKRVERMLPDIVKYIENGENIPLETDPYSGSFCYHLARSKRPSATLGVSILQRCILPGVEITIKRDDIIQNIPVEQVDTDTDLLLTHTGTFEKAVKGSRHVSEEILSIQVEGIQTHLKLTSDHRVLVLKDDQEQWIQAGDLHIGDTLLEAPIVDNNTPKKYISLAEEYQGYKTTVSKQNRENHRGHDNSTRDIEVIDTKVKDQKTEVVFQYKQDQAQMIDSVEKDEKLLTWLQNLTEPVIMSYKELSSLLGIPDVNNSVYRLIRDLSIKVDKGEDRKTIWYSVDKNLILPTSYITYSMTSPVTSFEINEDFCYLIGTWLGDGDVWTNERNFLNLYNFGWTFGKDSDDLRSLVLDKIHKVFGDVSLSFTNGFAKYDTTSTTKMIRVNDTLLAKWVTNQFGTNCSTKRLPSWIFDLSESCILALLRGILDTDGFINHRTVDIQLNNRILINQLHLLCNKVGIDTSIKISVRKPHTLSSKWKTKDGWKEKTYTYEEKEYWRLICSNTISIKKWGLGSLKGNKVQYANPRIKSKFYDGKLQRKIKNIDREHYQGIVYSFDVGNSSLVANSLIIHNCLRTLLYREKLRQAQTSIASRNMTPKRVVTGENLDEIQLEELREQVDLALMDPDFSIVTNYPVQWDEYGVNDRLLDLSNEYDITDRQLMIGLGVTLELLTGEGSYTGNRISLHVMNERFMSYRMVIQRYVENYLFKPVAIKMGFVEKDAWGYDIPIYPKLGFNRMALMDNQDVFSSLFDLYQKGSLPIDFILDLFNIDVADVEEKLKRDFATMNDANFNEVIRNALGDVGNQIAEKTDLLNRVVEHLGLRVIKTDEGDRFG